MSKQLGRISGPLLNANLLRDGTDLRFENQLLYLDVSNKTISINSTPINKTLYINDTLKTNDIIVDAGKIAVGTIEIGPNNLIRSTNSTITLRGTDYVQTHIIQTDNLEITGRSISTYTLDTDIEVRPTGILDIYANTNIAGNLHSTGSITADGSIIFGSNSSDSVTFDADINSDILPNVSGIYSLGEDGKQWNDVRTKDFIGQIIYTNGLFNNNLPVEVTAKNQWFVAVLGLDTNVGINESSAFATVAKALSVADSGDTVYIAPGTYTEVFPLIVPAGVTVKGAGIRSVTVQPTSGTNTNNAFLLNGETAVSDLTVANFYEGYAFSFALGAKVTTRSPYVQNCSVITSGASAGKGALVDGSVVDATSNEASMLFHSTTFITPGVDALTMTNGVRVEWLNSFTYFANRSIYATQGMVPSGSLTFSGSNYLSLSTAQTIGTQAYTFECFFYTASNGLQTLLGASASGGMSVWLFGDGINPVTTIQIDRSYVDAAVYTVSPITVNTWHHIAVTRDSLNNASVFLDGVKATGATTNTANYTGPSGLIGAVAGSAYFFTGYLTQIKLAVGSNYYDPTAASISVPTAVLTTSANTKLLLTAATSGSYITDTSGTQTVSNVGGVTYNTSTPFLVRTGAELRSIGSASVYGNYGAVADGADTLMYLIQHNFGYVGSGLDSSNDRTLVVQANETVELNNGKIYFQSVDQQGNYRVGEQFYVDFDNGTTSIDISSGAINGISSLTIGTAPNQTFIDYSKIDTGDFTLRGNDILTKSQTFNIVSATGEVNTESIAIAKDLSVAGDVNIGGTITVGNQTSDSIDFSAKVDSDIVPATTKDYTLGNNDKRWASLTVNESYINDVKISANEISILTADTNLVLNATGKVLLPNNNVEINQALRVDGTSTLSNVNIFGTVTHTGNYFSNPGFVTGAQATTEDGRLLVTEDGIILKFEDKISGNIKITGNVSATVSGKFSDITFVNDTIRSDTSLNFALLSGTGKLNIVSNNSDISIKNNRIINNKNDPIVFSTNGGYVKFAGTGAMAIPVGLESERPAVAETGTLRVNSTSGNAEVYTQPTNTWNDVTGLGDIATREVVEEYGNLWILILG